MNLRYTDTDALHTMALVLDILHADNNAILNTYDMFCTMTDDDFDLFVGGVAGTLLNLNVDVNNTRLVEYIILSEIDFYMDAHSQPATTIVVDGTDRNTGEIMCTKELLIDSSDERRTCMRVKGLLLGFRNKDYDIHVRMHHN